MNDICVFKARKIITMDPNQPTATHVAVREGKIIAVGNANCADGWGKARHDESLADHILMPGFVEGHAHLMAGGIWNYAYAGFHERVDPDGNLWPALTSIEKLIEGLSGQEKHLDAEKPLIAWGFDPIFLPGERLNRHHLDKISATRPVVVLYSNLHLMCANSTALEMVGYNAQTNVEGIVKDPDGTPSGELQEMAAMFPILRRLGVDFRKMSQNEEALSAFGKIACRTGVTTMTDLYSSVADEDLPTMKRIVTAKEYPLRVVPVLGASGVAEEVARRAKDLARHNHDKLRFGAVKLMTDGSIQGWTARVKWPGYLGGRPNGLWNMAPAQIFELCETMQRENLQMHIHVNGDEASQIVLNALEAAMAKYPNRGLRHVLQHGQMMGADQFRRCAELGVMVNLFANHIWYFGDQHIAHTIGEDRAKRMNGARAALDAGVNLAIHSDAPVTPLGPLFTAWCAVNRLTMSGRTLGAEQRISIQEALYAITLGAARSLKLDHEIGSIETGKAADFAILGEDPLNIAPRALRDIPVLGTISGGELHLI